jgi:hypothetical protein
MIDPDSDTWRAVDAALRENESRLLAQLASPNLDFTDTQYLRGQLAALRDTLKLANPAPGPRVIAPEDYFR